MRLARLSILQAGSKLEHWLLEQHNHTQSEAGPLGDGAVAEGRMEGAPNLGARVE